MCGIDFVTPFQGLNMFWGHRSQGVALGYHVMALSAREGVGSKFSTQPKLKL